MKGKKHSFYGLISGLIFLCPIFPILTLFPIFGLEWVLEKYFFNCVIGYKIAYMFSLILAIIVDFIYLCRVVRKNIPEKEEIGYIFSEKEGFGFIFFFNLLLYSLVNSYIFIIIVGTENICHVDGQTGLVVIFSGPISSIVIFVNGLIIDLVKYMMNKSKVKE